MSTDFNVTIEYATREAIDEQLLNAFAPYHPATGRSAAGNVEVIITIPGTDVVQLLQTSAAIVAQQQHAPVVSVEVIRTADFDRRVGSQTLPELVSVTEAAELAGVSRQAILQRLESGTLSGSKVGNTWVVQRAHLMTRYPNFSEAIQHEIVTPLLNSGRRVEEYDVNAIAVEVLHGQNWGYARTTVTDAQFWDAVERHRV